jgi:hypothetical protein
MFNWSAVAVVVTIGCTDKFAPATWADHALEGFDRIFNNDNEK